MREVVAVAFKDIALLSSTRRDGHASPRIDPSASAAPIPRRAGREKATKCNREFTRASLVSVAISSSRPLPPFFSPFERFSGPSATVTRQCDSPFGGSSSFARVRGAPIVLSLSLSRSRARGNLCGGDVFSDVRSSRLENVGRLVDARPTSSLPPRLIVGDQPRDAARDTRVARHRALSRLIAIESQGSASVSNVVVTGECVFER